jgi:hypothetical protein
MNHQHTNIGGTLERLESFRSHRLQGPSVEGELRTSILQQIIPVLYILELTEPGLLLCPILLQFVGIMRQGASLFFKSLPG